LSTSWLESLDFSRPNIDIGRNPNKNVKLETVMTDDTTKNGPDEAATDLGVETEAAVAEESQAEAAAAAQEPDPIEVLKTENADLRDRYLRLAAEMDNLRRRTERDVKDAKSYAIAGFARDMLGVSDNLRRALDAIPAEAKEAGEAGLMALIEGVELTERSMLAAMERHGVKKLEPEGQKFDPNFHQAMFEIPNTDVPNNTVLQVVQAGYVIGERMLRPAMVGVSKGGPKAAAAESADAEKTA
jgi:molecular chaperone GrpE